MTTTLLPDTTPPPLPQESASAVPAEWDLDVSFLESGDDIDTLIYMTNDNCGQTCQSACVSCR